MAKLLSRGNYITLNDIETCLYKRTAPVAPNAAGVLAAQTLATGVTLVVTTGFTQPGVARNFSIVGNQASAVGNVVLTGTNIDDQVITETIVAAGTASVAGNKAFKTLTSVTLPARGAAADTISIGLGSKLGLDFVVPGNTILFAMLAGVREATLPTVPTAPADLASSTAQLSSALNGTEVRIYYLNY
jgi:hypothetical protein